MPRRWLLLGFLTVGMFFCYFHRMTLSVAAPFMMRELKLDTAQMGILLSAFFWTYSLAQVPSGILVDRLGLGRAYAAGYFLWTLGIAFTGFVTTLPALIAIRMFLGIGQGVAFPASTRATANFFPASERGGVTGVYLAGNRIGQAAIAGIGPLIISMYGWRAFFWVSALAGLVWLVPWILTLKFWDEKPAAIGASAKADQPSGWTLLRDRRIAGVVLGFFAYDYVWYLIMTWMPGYLMLERKFTAREMGIATAAPYLAVSVVVIVAGVAGDWLVRRGWEEILARKALITVGLLGGLLIVPAAFVESNLAAAWLMAGSIIGLSVASPNTWALTQAVCPRPLVATASGIQNLGGNLGGVLAPALTGYLAHFTGSFGIAFVIAGLILLGGIAAYWILIPGPNKPMPALAETV